MKEFIEKEKLTARLEEETIKNKEVVKLLNEQGFKFIPIKKAIEIVNQFAEEYKDKYVSKAVLEQIMWERDIAVLQLRDLGYGLGEKVGWIPCEKELPKDGVVVDLSCEYMGVLYETVGYLKDGNRGHSYIVDDDVFMRSAVLAWKKRPAPYTEGE